MQILNQGTEANICFHYFITINLATTKFLPTYLRSFVHQLQDVALHSDTPCILPACLSHPRRPFCLDQIIPLSPPPPSLSPFALFTCRGYYSMIFFYHLLVPILAMCPAHSHFLSKQRIILVTLVLFFSNFSSQHLFSEFDI